MKYNRHFLRKDGTLDYRVYAKFFADNIQYLSERNEEVIDTMTYNSFSVDWNNNLQNYNAMKDFILGGANEKGKEERLANMNKHHKALSDIGIKIDFANLYYLCQYIMKMDENWYLALLKPTTKETIEMIGNIKKISFTNTDGGIVETTLSSIIEPIKEVLANITNNTIYEVDKIVCINEFSNPEILQANFVYFLSRFLREYFPNTTRRSNSYISDPEKYLVLEMLSYFNLAPKEGLSLSRFRQLRMFALDIVEHFGFFILEGYGLVPISFVKYEDWKDKKLSYIIKTKKIDGEVKRTKEDRITTDYKKVLSQLEVGDTIIFTKSSIEKLLLKR